MSFDFVGKDGFESRSATEVKTEEGEVGNRGGPADRARFLLAGEIGFGPLLVELGKRNAFLTDEIERGGASDFLEGFPEKFLLPLGGSF